MNNLKLLTKTDKSSGIQLPETIVKIPPQKLDQQKKGQGKYGIKH